MDVLTPGRSLTAAGSPIVAYQRPRGTSTGGQPPSTGDLLDPAAPDAIRARSEKWQLRILEYAEAIPEVAGASALVRASIESVRWVVDGTGGFEGAKGRAQARIDTMDFGRLAELIWLSGEGFIGVPEDDMSRPVEEIDPLYSLSVAELNTHVKPATVFGPNGEMRTMLDPFMRIWRPAKGNRWKASSPNKSAMDLLDAMYLSQLADTAIHRSRLAGAGIVFWPTDAPDIPVAEGETPVPGSRQAMLGEFEDAAWSAIDKQNSREATIPFVVMYNPGTRANVGSAISYKPEMFRIERENGAQDYALGVATRRERYAAAVELPIEAVIGMGGTNHWSAWQIDVDKWKTWFAPLCELIRAEIERRLVKMYGPALKLTVDSSALIQKPDQTDVVVKLAQLEITTPESVQAALVSGKLEDLVMKDPPPRTYSSNVAPGQPSDFGSGDTNRGGGKFRDKP